MATVCFVSNSAWSVFNFRIDVLRHLMQTGHQVLVMAAADEFAAELEKEGCRFIPLDFNNRTVNPISDFRLYRQLKQLYRLHRPDIIFHYVIKPNIYGSLAAAAVGIPSVAVITGLGYSFSKKGWLYRLTKILYAKALRQAVEVWFLNNEDAKFFISRKMTSLSTTRVMHGEGVNTNWFKRTTGPAPRNEFTFLMSARLLRSKGVDVYADAARILRRKGYTARFVLIGFFEEKHPDSLSKQLLAEWQQQGLVEYQGFAADVRPALAEADCFVFPSFYNEGVPRSLMEAASMELPVITSRNRGCTDVVVDGETGFLCNTRDPFDLADKMERLLQLTVGERAAMGAAGRALVCRNFDVNTVIGLYDQAIQSAVFSP